MLKKICTFENDAERFLFRIHRRVVGDPLEGEVLVMCETRDPEYSDSVTLGRFQIAGQRVEAEEVLIVRVAVGNVLKHDLH